MRNNTFVFKKTQTRKFTGLSVDFTVQEAREALDMLDELTQEPEESDAEESWGKTAFKLHEALSQFILVHGHRPSPSNE